MFETTPRTMIGAPTMRQTVQNQQPRRLILALSLLLITLVALLVKDRQFWFGTEQANIDTEMPETASVATPVSAATHPAHSVAMTSRKASAATTAAQPAVDSGVSVTRTVLPPLDIEVISGDKHHKLHPGTNVTHVEIPTAAPTTDAAEREPLPAAVQPHPTPTSYPLLAQHMNVQGSVVLQAVISAQGIVENLRVLSGPAILTTAAQQAVREWRFKPVIQNGQAVETKATVTVNFSIKVADNSARTTLAESRASEILVVSR